MRMYALPLTITLLSVIALAQCGTLRQYGRDWLIPKPDPEVESKRITAKSVFIAPSFTGADHVRCGAGFQQDAATGRCVKVVHVNEAAQLDFLLQRLNSMYGAPVISGLPEKQPLQFNVEIPVQSENETSSAETGGMYSSDMMLPPEGGVSIDLLVSVAEHTTKDTYEVKPVEEEKNRVPQVPYGQTVLPESEEHETDVIVVPSKKLFHADQEPIVVLAEDDDSTEKAPVDSDFEALFEKEDGYMTATVDSDVTNVSAAVGKKSSVVGMKTVNKKESVHLVNDSNVQPYSEAALPKNQTQSHFANGSEVTQSDHLGNSTRLPPKGSFHNEDNTKESSTGGGIVYNNIEAEDEMENMLPSENTGKRNRTLSQVSKLGAVHEVTSVLLSHDQSSSPLTESVPSNGTAGNSVSSIAAHNVGNPDTPKPPVIGGLLYLEAGDTFVKQTDQTADTDDLGGDSDYAYPDDSLDVGDYSASYEEDRLASASTEPSAMPSNANKSATTSDDSFDLASGDGNLNERESGGDAEVISVNFNQSVSLNSTNGVQKTESGNGFNVANNNGTGTDAILSFLGENANTPPKAEAYVSGGNGSHFDSSGVTLVGEDDLESVGFVHNVNNETPKTQGKPPSDLQEAQQVVTSQHIVQVVYPQPTVQVLNVKQDSHGHTLSTANSNEPKTVPKGTADSNSSPHQFHNLNPNPLHHHNSHPAPYVPLPERVPDHPHKYGGYPYPAQAPNHHPYRPYHQFHPQTARPQEQSGFVRFPTDRVQEAHRSHPYALAHAQRQAVAGNAVRFPQEESRTNDKYSRWGNWGVDAGGGGVEAQQRVWTPPENRRNYWHHNRPARRRPQLSYY